MIDVVRKQLIPNMGYEDRGNHCVWSPDERFMIEDDCYPLKIQIHDESLLDGRGNPLPTAKPYLEKVIELMKPTQIVNVSSKDISHILM